MADTGLTVNEIHDRLDYPLSASAIGDIVWKHYTDTGVILLTEPDSTPIEKKSYIKETDAYGRTTFRRITETAEPPATGYLECDIGLLKHRDPNAYDEVLGRLDSRDRDYVTGLPWPRARVWHVADDRMKRIMSIFHPEETGS